MSDEQTIYISPDDDLTTVRERLEQIPSRKITLVIPSQTQLRSHVAWKLLYARARELSKEVLIVSSDPQVRSVAHGVKFRVAHSLESISSPMRPKSGNRGGTGRSNAGVSRGRLAVPPPPTTTAKEPTSRRGASRLSRSTRPPLAGGETSTWSEPGSFPLSDPHTVKPNEPRPRHLNLPEQPERDEMREERSSHYNPVYDFHAEAPPPIRPLSLNQIEEEEPDLLTEDYAQAQDIREAASGSFLAVQKSEDSAPAITSTGNVNPRVAESPANQPPRQASQVYGEDDPFIYMQDDSQPPAQSEQKGEAILQDDEVSRDYSLLQKSAISDLPTIAIENRIEDRGDDDQNDIIPPITPTPITQTRSQDIQFEEEDEKVEERPSHLSSRPYGVPPRESRSGITPPSRQTSSEAGDQYPSGSSVPMQVPQPIPLPTSPTSPRPGGRMQQQVPTQRPSTDLRTRSGPRAPQLTGSRPASQTSRPRGAPAGPRSAIGTSTRGPASRNRLPRPGRLFLVLVSIVVIFVILFGVLYLTATSTVNLSVTTQDYAHSLTLTLSSDKNQTGTVPAAFKAQTFTKTGSEPATGSIMQATNNATGIVNFTNTGTTPVQIPSQTVVATRNGATFVTTANALILPQSPTTVPVPIQASNQGVSGNVLAGTITIIPPDSLTRIAQTQSPPVTADSLKAALTVSNPEATTGGEAHQVAAVTQQDLAKAQSDLLQQVQPDINAWLQDLHKTGLVGQPIVNGTLTNPPAVDTPEPNGTFSASINVTVTVLFAQLNVVQGVALSQLNHLVQTDKGANFVIIGDPQTITIDLAQQTPGQGNTVTVPATGQIGLNFNTVDLRNSIKGKPISEAQNILSQKNQSIKNVDIQTLPGIFNSVSPWVDHINVIVRSAPKK